VLSAILACMNNGMGGNKRRRTQVKTGFDAVDLTEEHNSLGIFYLPWGRQEPFVRGRLQDKPALRKPRWFKFGNICAINVKEQMEIAKELIGDVTVGGDKDDPAVLPMYIIKRRKESYAKFYGGRRKAVYATGIGMCRSLSTVFWTCGRVWN